MTYNEQGERVTLEMTRDEWQSLIILVGYAAGAASKQGDKEHFYRWTAFANQMNATNPHWTPYEIPAEYASSGD